MLTTVPYLTTKNVYSCSNESKRALTLAMLEKRYSQETWIRVYTGSPTRAVWGGGAVVHIRFLDGQKHLEEIPTGLRCTNYRAEVQALIHT
jgi:hypothetical protein